ncbi:MAG: hypothetical protein ACR2OM_15880, partial [Aestuariivirgaceae bacterium]
MTIDGARVGRVPVAQVMVVVVMIFIPSRLNNCDGSRSRPGRFQQDVAKPPMVFLLFQFSGGVMSWRRRRYCRATQRKLSP